MNGTTLSTALKACFGERSSHFLAGQVQPLIRSRRGGPLPAGPSGMYWGSDGWY